MKNRLKEAHFNDTADRPVLCIAAKSTNLCGEIEETMNSHVRVCRSIFRQIADQAPGLDRLIDDIKPADGNGAGRGGYKACDHPHSSGLAGPIWAKKAQNLASLHRKRDPINGVFSAEDLDQILNFYHKK